MKIGFDVDGVLADFNTAFIERVIQVTGRDLFPARPFDIPCWAYPRYYGYTPEEESAVWRHVTDDPTFWLNLAPYDDAPDTLWRLRELSCLNDVYFITARPGRLAKQQTEIWLATQSGDFMWNPTVLMSGDKGECARVLGLDVYIDDKWDNAVSVAYAGPLFGSFLLERPWNRNLGDKHIRRVKTTREMLSMIGAISLPQAA